MSLTRIDESLLLAAYFRGGSQDQRRWISNTDQILTLSLFFTGDISEADCVYRFANRSYIRKLYQDIPLSDEHPWGKLTEEIDARYKVLINLLQERPDLIEGGGNFEFPAHPTFTACRLTNAGLQLAESLALRFPQKPDFPDWPDKRTLPQSL